MSEKYKFHDPDALYFITTTVTNWIDVFTKSEYCEIVLDSFRYCRSKKGLVIHAWVIMPNHLHLIVSRKGNIELSDIIRSFKTFTSIELVKTLIDSTDPRKGWILNLFKAEANRLKRVNTYKFWKDGNHPILLDSNKKREQRLTYLHHNPVKAGIVEEDHHYVYSSALDYCEEKGLIDIEMIQ